MFCNYINDIYKNHIYRNLIDDELIVYSYPIREHFLDLLNKSVIIKILDDDSQYRKIDDYIFHLEHHTIEITKNLFDLFENEYFIEDVDLKYIVKGVKFNNKKYSHLYSTFFVNPNNLT